MSEQTQAASPRGLLTGSAGEISQALTADLVRAARAKGDGYELDQGVTRIAEDHIWIALSAD